METIFLKLLTPELVGITKPKNTKTINYNYFFDYNLVYSVAWIYKYYFEETVVVFLPKCVCVEETLNAFNGLVGEFVLDTSEIKVCTLETLETKQEAKVVIYGFGDFIFSELCTLNKRRIITCLKNMKNKVCILSYTSLPFLQAESFQRIPFNTFPTFEYNCIDCIDPDKDIFESNVESFVEFVLEHSETKKIYISLNMNVTRILFIEKALKEAGVNVSRKEETGVVIHSSKTIKTFLKNTYDIYIFITQDFEDPVDILYYLKEVRDAEIFIDSSKIKNVYSALNDLRQPTPEKTLIKDSIEYDSYKEIQTIENSVVVSDYYYRFEAPESIQNMDLSNLSKKEYDCIRNFVKIKLQGKLDNVKTCQLCSPSSPKDRSKKLNSLSNKISSYDYRCDVTCEIFKDYTIGVVVWNEMFSNRKKINVLKNQVYIYQTTKGTWKYTTIN